MNKKRDYRADSSSNISDVELSNSEKEIQIEVMQSWFSSNYEDPAENTPYESKEGGYIYIWGGPYDAREELENEFADIVPNKVIDELASELEGICYEWTGVPSEDHYDDFYYDVMSANTEFHGTLTENLNIVRKLLKSETSEDSQVLLNRMLFVHLITALETFLSDAFIGTVIGNKELLRTFVQSNTDFSDRKLSLNEIFKRMDSIEKEVRNYLLDLIWHNLAKVKNLYKNTLEINFPDDMNILYKAVAKRHDIVHRSGKSKEGDEVHVSKEEIDVLLTTIREFADHVDSYWGN